MKPRFIPWLTIAVFIVCGAFTAAQFGYPQLIPALQRQPSMFNQFELWRLVTSLLVHDGGWPQIAGNFISLFVIGTLAEWLVNRWLWLLAFFAGGISGNIIGYFWQPYGAGNSIAFYGLLGLLAAWLLSHPVRNQSIRYGLPLIVAFLSFVLCLVQDVHGVPLLVGLFIGLAAYRTVRNVD
ncbi:MAG TPA: rhomboid family intramembrane serine protease [Devosiaceae bacterium]|jgi:rhomboid protease GluP